MQIPSRDDCICSRLCNGLVTGFCILGIVATDARNGLVVANQVKHTGKVGASPVALSVTLITRIFSVLPLMSRWILRR